ncbi:hypothetical protein HZP25_11700 [Elizabethkingia anophelis]|nr:hypothetical protein [Elizabethkingia anophelis]
MEGKAKEAFKKWFDNKYLDNWNYYNITENNAIMNALTIEWLDSVGIYITIDFTKPYWYVIIIPSNGIGNYIMEENGFLSRQEATEAAIKKAVEIYNARFS